MFRAVRCYRAEASDIAGGGKHLFERSTFRKLMMEINSVGGYKLLDCPPALQMEGVLDDIIGNKLKLSIL